MKEQGQVLCAGRPPRKAETAVTRPWEPARPRAHRLTGLGAGWEGRDVLLTFSRGEGLALPCSLVPSVAAPRRGVTRLCGLGRCVGVPVGKTSFTAEFDGQGRCGPHVLCPSLPCDSRLLSGRAVPLSAAGPAGPLPSPGRELRARFPWPSAGPASCRGHLRSRFRFASFRNPTRSRGSRAWLPPPSHRRLVL